VEGQILNLPHRFTNDSAKFTIGSVQPDWEKDDFVSKTVIEVINLDSADWNKIKLPDRKSWLGLLNDPKVDWIANLALYQMYRRSAGIFRVVKTRDVWIQKSRKEDIAYWEKTLK
jgi:hypothetical protein